MKGMTTIERRWRFLEDEPAVSYAGFFPPADNYPELAHLRAEHERLLAAVSDAQAHASELHRRASAEQDARADAMRDAVLSGGKPGDAELAARTVTDEQIAEAHLAADAAREALQTFAQHAVAEVVELAPQMHAELDARVLAAEEKREQARRLLAEAERDAAEPKRMRNWLDRCTGESTLGLYPFEEMGLPLPVPVPPLFERVAGLRPAEVIDVGSDEILPEELAAVNDHAPGNVEVMTNA
jgi:hypothetical protein